MIAAMSRRDADNRRLVLHKPAGCGYDQDMTNKSSTNTSLRHNFGDRATPRIFANPQDIQSNGLCAYSNAEDWFDHKKQSQAMRICANCPLRKACAQAALDLGERDGLWAGVRLPGFHATLAEHAIAQRQLTFIVSAMDQQPESHRQRTLAIREATHHAAFPPQRPHLAAERASA